MEAKIYPGHIKRSYKKDLVKFEHTLETIHSAIVDKKEKIPTYYLHQPTNQQP